MSNPSIFTSDSYTYMVFKSSATVTLPRANVDYLIIGGGGAGGKNHAGGGGAGRVIYGSTIVDTDTYNIVVGSGGIASSLTDGISSSVFGINALGGGRGGGMGMDSGPANSGGSGGGGGGYNPPFSGGTAIDTGTNLGNNLGNNGGNGSNGGGGGGGAGSIGGNSVGKIGGIGGSGTSDYASLLTVISNIMAQAWKTATNNGQIIASGGSGGSWEMGSVTAAPIGGGGDGGDNNSSPITLPTKGIDNTGGGGGGGGSGNQTGADGGSGLVIIRYTVAPPCFKEGSKILTNLGYKRVEELIKGDMVKTLLNDYKPIAMIGKCDFNHPASKERIKKQLYKCSQNKYPELFEDLIITGCHSILVENSTSVVNETQIEKVKEVNGGIYLTDGKLRLPACIDERTSIYEGEKGIYTIYHLALENDDYYMNYGIYANGLLVESCSKRYLVELSGMELV